MIGAPLANILMNNFKTPDLAGVWQTFVVMAAIYFAFMIGGASVIACRLPDGGRRGGSCPRRSPLSRAARCI